MKLKFIVDAWFVLFQREAFQNCNKDTPRPAVQAPADDGAGPSAASGAVRKGARQSAPKRRNNGADHCRRNPTKPRKGDTQEQSCMKSVSVIVAIALCFLMCAYINCRK